MPHISFRVTEEEEASYRALPKKDGRDLTQIIKDYLDKLVSKLGK